MNQGVRTFILTALTLTFLLFMYGLPPLTVGGMTLRGVDVLSDINPISRQDQSASLIPAPEAPRQVKNEKGKAIDFKEQWPKGVVPIIDYSAGQPGGMDHFYEALAHAKQENRAVRIAYFSDSFTENNIFTADLRECFQARYGGSGPGWIDAANPINRNDPIYKLSFSGLKEYSATQKPFNKQRQGIAERYFTGTAGASINVKGTSFREHAATWNVATLYMRSRQGATVAVAHGNAAQTTEKVGPSQQVQAITTRGQANAVNYKFKQLTTADDVFGVALESSRGVVVDNFSLRGSSGSTLANIPITTLKEFAKLRPYDLIIIHYGLNVAIKGNPMAIMQKYEKDMARVVDHLRQAYPDASLLVMSISDRDQRTASGIQTLKEVKQLAALQQNMAAEKHVAFLSLLQVMTGDVSMKNLVDRRQANKDYTHLSYGGGKRVAQKAFQSFVAGHSNYLRRKKQEQAHE